MKTDSNSSKPIPSPHALTEPDPLASLVLDYLEHHLPGYRFHSSVDSTFVQELRADFPDINLLEEIKTFRWYHNNQLPSFRNHRVALRRWMARARSTARE